MRLLLAAVIGLTAFTITGTVATPAWARYAAIVVEAESGRVLYERNADTRNYPASLTKMMTLYMVFEALERGELKLDQTLTASRRAAGQAPSRLGLKQGDRITVRDAILALVTKSANDVATTVAEALGGKETTFAKQMTAKARELGMTNTIFRNASGLPNRRQKSTARDMARLAVALQRNFPQYYAYFSERSFAWHDRTYENHNKLLTAYNGTDGVKTGYTRASGFNLVASTQRNGTRLIGVVFGGKTASSRNRHMIHILDIGFKRAGNPAKAAAAKVMDLPGTSGRLPKRFRDVPLPPERPGVPELTTASATPASITVPEVGGSWRVQVGAFSAAPAAEERLNKLSIRFPRLFDGDDALIDTIERHGSVLYRAQFRGLDERSARQACRVLMDSKLACVPVPPAEAALATVADKG